MPYEKVGKNEPVCIADEVPFEIPESWEWVRLFNLGDNINDAFADGPFGSNLKKEHYTDRKELRLIQLSNIGESQRLFILSVILFCSATGGIGTR